MPDARLSEVAVAFVQRQSAAALTEGDVIEHCRGRLASFKIPRHVAFVQEFPLTTTRQDSEGQASRARPERVARHTAALTGPSAAFIGSGGRQP